MENKGDEREKMYGSPAIDLQSALWGINDSTHVKHPENPNWDTIVPRDEKRFENEFENKYFNELQ